MCDAQVDRRSGPMPHRTRSQYLPYAEHVKNLEASMRSRAQGLGSMRTHSISWDSRPQRRDVNTQTREVQMIDVMEQAGADYDREILKSRSNLSEKPRRAKHHLVSSACDPKFVEKQV